MVGWLHQQARGEIPQLSRIMIPIMRSFVGEGQTEETHSGKGETRIGGGSFDVFPGLWTMACD
jgi:hypothetical protein